MPFSGTWTAAAAAAAAAKQFNQSARGVTRAEMVTPHELVHHLGWLAVNKHGDALQWHLSSSSSKHSQPNMLRL
jgi:hypothetical protein